MCQELASPPFTEASPMLNTVLCKYTWYIKMFLLCNLTGSIVRLIVSSMTLKRAWILLRPKVTMEVDYLLSHVIKYKSPSTMKILISNGMYMICQCQGTS